MMALSEVLPKRVTAGWNPQLCGIINGIDSETGEPFVDILLNGAKAAVAERTKRTATTILV